MEAPLDVPAPLTLGKAIEGYLQWSKAENKESTYREKIGVMGRILRYFDAGRGLESLDVPDIEHGYKVHRRTQTARHGKGPPCGATINRELAFLQGLFTWAKATRRIKASPFDSGAIRKCKENPSEWRYLAPGERERLIGECPERLRPMVAASLATGMRMGEARNLLWRQVDFSLGVLHLVNTKSRNRSLRIGKALAEMLERLPRRCEHVFSHDDGRPMSKSYIEHQFEWAAKRAGIMRFSFHGLRRTYATDLYRQTRDIRKVQHALGHSSISTTERYLLRLGIMEDGAEADAMTQAVFSDGIRKALGMGEVAAPPREPPLTII